MRVLLDTHTFLWWGSNNPKLSGPVHDILTDESNEVLFSAVSGWEIAIKASLGKLDNIPADLESFVIEEISGNAFEVLPIRLDHSLRVHTLPWHHKDPFDRLLIAQAVVEEVPLLSRDPEFEPYLVEVIW